VPFAALLQRRPSKNLNWALSQGPARALLRPLQFGEQLLAPDRRDHAAPAALVARLGPEWQSAQHCAPAVVGSLGSCPIARIRRDRHSPSAPWLWVWCRNVRCRHKAPVALAPLIIRWGRDASSDLLRQSARCRRCGRRGADLQHPSVRSSDIALAFHAKADDWS